MQSKISIRSAMAPPQTIGDNVARLKKAFLHLGAAGSDTLARAGMALKHWKRGGEVVPE